MQLNSARTGVEQRPASLTVAAQEAHLNPEVQGLLGSVTSTWGQDVPDLSPQPLRGLGKPHHAACHDDRPAWKRGPGSRDTPSRLQVTPEPEAEAWPLCAGEPPAHRPQDGAHPEWPAGAQRGQLVSVGLSLWPLATLACSAHRARPTEGQQGGTKPGHGQAG